MIIGTAGHVDHGKTSLVKALTGIDTDRLPEEKRRGITLELGFAHLDLNGTRVGVVDVPGHERFVRAMAAGAGGVDLAMLVVAADEGVMPQTREHVDICQLLGVKTGLIVVTKSDLLPTLGEGWLELLTQDLRALTKGTFLEEAPVLPVSAKTGEGLEALKAAIAANLSAGPVARPAEGPVFLPIDGVFTVKGFGAVVTGTLLSGRLERDAQVSLVPGLDGPFRARTLQVHGAAVESTAAGQRVAVNVPGIETGQVSRGMALVRSSLREGGPRAERAAPPARDAHREGRGAARRQRRAALPQHGRVSGPRRAHRRDARAVPRQEPRERRHVEGRARAAARGAERAHARAAARGAASRREDGGRRRRAPRGAAGAASTRGARRSKTRSIRRS